MEDQTATDTRRAREIDGDTATASEIASRPFHNVVAPNNNGDSLDQSADCLVKDQPSHEDVMRLEEENETMRRSNEAKNVVLDVIYDQVPKQIKKMLDNCLGSENLRFSQLSEEELRRLTKWLTERKPFEDIIKESDLGMYVYLQVCIKAHRILFRTRWRSPIECWGRE